MMRSVGFLFMLLLIGTAAFVYLGFSSKGSIILNPVANGVVVGANLDYKIKFAVMVGDALTNVIFSGFPYRWGVATFLLHMAIGMVSIGGMNAMTLTMKRRKLKLQQNTNHPEEDGDVRLEDYRPIDPIPSSTASIRHGPIQHGTPLMPYIPEPSPPPSQSSYGEFP